MAVSNAAAALGQEIGKLFENAIVDVLRPMVEEHNHTIGPERLVNGTDNVYQIDAIIRNKEGNPVMLLDPKYIRYKKHNRDKGSWLCTAHYNLRKTYPSIRKTIAILAGNWSATSVSLITSFGVEVHMLPFSHMVDALQDCGIMFKWGEKDRETPKQALQTYKRLGEDKRKDLARRLINPIISDLKDSVLQIIQTDMASSISRISGVEVLLKTDQNEMLLLQYKSVSEAVKDMVSFMSELADVTTFLEK